MAELVRLPDVAMAAMRRREADGLPPIGKCGAFDRDRIIAIGPDEWLVVGQDGDATALLGRLAALGAFTTDVSGNRIGYRVEGRDAIDLLSAGCSLDLEALRPGDAVSTLLARGQVIIFLDDDGQFIVLPRRSFGRYVEDWARVAGE